MLTVALAGCDASPPRGLVIEGVIAPDATCMADAYSPLLVEGTLDIGSSVSASARPDGLHYFVALRIASYLPARACRDVCEDGRRLVASRVDVELFDAAGAPLEMVERVYSVPALGSVMLDRGVSPSRGIAWADVLPELVGVVLARIRPTLIEAQLTLHGTTESGAEVTSNAYRFPIRLCDGCLFACRRAASGNAIEQPSCIVGQDAITLTCR